MVLKFFQKVTPLYDCLDKAFVHRDTPCTNCAAADKPYCTDGYVYYDKAHSSYCGTCERNCKELEPQKLLKMIASDFVKGIEHTEKEGFRDKNYKSKYKRWFRGHQQYMNEKEAKFKKRWERKKEREESKLEEDMKAESGSNLERPKKLRRTLQNRRVSQEASSDSDSEEESEEESEKESDDSSVVSVYSESN